MALESGPERWHQLAQYGRIGGLRDLCYFSKPDNSH